LVDERLAERSAELGRHLLDLLRDLRHPAVREVRGRGLWVGVELESFAADGRSICEAMMRRGVLARETHRSVVRFAPPLTIERHEIDLAVTAFAEALDEVAPS
jgi:ornithine--oxo-acid transaminase